MKTYIFELFITLIMYLFISIDKIIRLNKYVYNFHQSVTYLFLMINYFILNIIKSETEYLSHK